MSDLFGLVADDLHYQRNSRTCQKGWYGVVDLLRGLSNLPVSELASNSN